jgi:ABC-2 type transport system ATP-binding protein
VVELAVRDLTKHFGAVRAVRELTFEVPPGRVTGFLGPNGAGKTTTLRALLGLVRPTSGEALIGGRPYADLSEPRRVVGAVLEATGFHPGRRGRDQLRVLAQVTGVAPGRVDQVLDLVGLAADARRRVGEYSLGMRQRLGLGAALLGDPAALVLDEPANGLDPEGMAWLRELLRAMAAEGRTILVSSHVLSEVAQVADHVVIVNQGRLRYAGALRDLGSGGGVVTVRVATGRDRPEAEVDRLRDALVARGLRVIAGSGSTLSVSGATAEDVGRVAVDERIVLSGLTETATSLEAAFLDLVRTDATTTDQPAPAGAR